MSAKPYEKMVMIPQRQYDELLRQAKQNPANTQSSNCSNVGNTLSSVSNTLSRGNIPGIAEKNNSFDNTSVEDYSEEGEGLYKDEVIVTSWKQNWNQL